MDSGQERAEDIVAGSGHRAVGCQDAARRPRRCSTRRTCGGRSAGLVSLDADLHVGLAEAQLRLLYQPIVDLSTRKMVGAEALLRWQHPVEGLLPRSRLLRSAEEAGLMVPITRWIVQR